MKLVWRTTIAIVGSMTLVGCVGDDPRIPPLGTTDGRMPVVVDYDPHRTLHPVPHHKVDRVDPVDRKVGRHRDFGPESAAETKGFFRAASQAGSTFSRDRISPSVTMALRDYFALANSRNAVRKGSIRQARKEPADTPDDVGDATADQAGAKSADNSNVESHDGSYRLNFEDAEIKDVLQVVLGKVLGLNYSIAPNVTGRITISSSAPQSRSDLFSTLETVLAMQGFSLTQSDSTYRVAPMSAGGGTYDVTGNTPGFGISVVPLQYSSAASMNKLLGGFVTDADGIRINTSRNTVIVRGPGPKRAEVVRAIKALDNDWMHTQSVSMFELKRSYPDELIPELMRIFANDKDGDAEGVIEFKAVKRLRSIMVLSKNETLIRRAGIWIRRLDNQDTSDVAGVFIYRPRYRSARDLVKLVSDLFGRGESSSPSQSSESSGREQENEIGTGRARTNGLSGGAGASSAGLNTGAQGGLGAGGTGGLAGNSSGSAFRTLTDGFKGDVADPVDTGQDLRAAGSKLKLTADPSNNAIVAYTDGKTYAKVKAVLSQIDVPPLQVAVNVIIAEVQLNDELKYGVQFFLNQSAKSVGSLGFSTSASSVASSATQGVVQGAVAGVTQVLSPSSGFNFISGGAASPNVIISALDSISKVHILSTPSIVVMENKSATFEVGNQVPVTTQQAQSNIAPDAPTVNSVTYLDTGIILKIIPRIGQDGAVDMQIDQEISSVVPDAAGSTTGSLTPTISKRRIASDISVRSGQNVLLAGLVTDTRSKSNNQVPFVGSQLGNLLGNTDNAFNRTELVMFLRPVIVRNGQDASEVTEDFRHGLRDIALHRPADYKR